MEPLSSMFMPELLVIRPPSEWRSALIRSTRGCNWNRCKFCGVYPALGEPEFSVRPVEDVMRDIDWYAEHRNGAIHAFIGDADPLCRPLDESVQIISHAKKRLPSLERITAYARAGTLFRIGSGGIRHLAAAGLSRCHLGLESGDLRTLKFHMKGQSPKIVIQATRWAREAGIEISMYVLLGLGGVTRWREHIDGTVEVINAASPEFIRMRRIWLFTSDTSGTSTACPLWNDMRSGRFEQQTPEGTVLELRRLIAAIGDVRSHLVCDHANNYLSVEGDFPADRERMLAEIDAFLALPGETRERHYRETGSMI